MGVRHIVIALALLIYTVDYVAKVDLSSAIVEITNTSAVNATVPRYNWTEATKSHLLNCLLVGYLWLQIPAGYIADLYDANLLISLSILWVGITKFLTPVAIFTFDSVGLAVCRITEGFGHAAIVPAITSVTGRWVTDAERMYLNQLVFGGMPFGTTLGLLTSGPLLSTKYEWPFMYYVEGIICVICSVLWFGLTSNSPVTHSFISEDEKKYITESLAATRVFKKSKLKVPWRHILTSAPVISLVIAHSARNYGYWTFFTQTPRFMSGVAHTNINETGIYSSLPSLLACASVIVYTLINASIQKRNLLSLIFRRRMWTTIALGGQGISCLLLVLLRSTEPRVIIIFLCIAMVSTVATYSGTLANQVDLSPNFAGIITGLSIFSGTISGIIATFAVSMIVVKKDSITEWSYHFLLSAGVSFLGIVIYLIFSSADTQPWNDPNYEKKTGTARAGTTIA